MRFGFCILTPLWGEGCQRQNFLASLANRPRFSGGTEPGGEKVKVEVKLKKNFSTSSFTSTCYYWVSPGQLAPLEKVVYRWKE